MSTRHWQVIQTNTSEITNDCKNALWIPTLSTPIFILLSLFFSTSLMASPVELNKGSGQNPALLVFVGGANDSNNKNMRGLANEISKDINYKQSRIVYTHFSPESAVFNQVVEHRCNYPYSTIILIGHSYGGATVMNIRNDDGIGAINLVVTLDGVETIGQEFGPTKLHEIQRWVNVYPKNLQAGWRYFAGAWRKESGATRNVAVQGARHGNATMMYRAVENEILAMLGQTVDTNKLDNLSSNIEAAVVHRAKESVYFFKNEQYQRYRYGQWVDKTATIGKHGWNGVHSNLDAAVYHPKLKAFYFFKGDKYQKYESGKGVTKIGTIGVHGWKGVSSDIDAAIYHPRIKAFYFFKGDKYQKYESGKGVTKNATIGVHGWKGVSSNIDAAFYYPKRDAFYFFTGNSYEKYESGKGVTNRAQLGKNNWRCVY